MKKLSVLIFFLTLVFSAQAQTTPITINISTANVVDIETTLCDLWGYKATIPNPNYDPTQWMDSPTNTVQNPNYDPNKTIANPKTKEQFIQAYIANWVKENYQYGKVKAAAKAAEDSIKNVTSTITIN